MSTAHRQVVLPYFQRLVEQKGSARVIDGLVEPGARVEVGGLFGSALPLWLAAHEARLPSLVVVVTPSTEEAEDVARDLDGFLDDGVGSDPPAALFPAWGHLGATGLAHGSLDLRVLSRRCRVLRDLAAARTSMRFIVAPVQALLEDSPPLGPFRSPALELRTGGEVDREGLAARLVDLELERVAMVESPGEFSMRGEIIDIHALGEDLPVRIELFGDTVESIRTFDPGTQRSMEERQALALVALRRTEFVTGGEGRGRLLPLLREAGLSPLVVLFDPPAISGRVERLEETSDPPSAAERYREAMAVAGDLRLLSVHRLPVAAGKVALNYHAREIEPAVDKELSSVVERLRELAALPADVTVFCRNEAVCDRFVTLLPDEPSFRERIKVVVGDLSHGFILPEVQVALATHDELFSARVRRRIVAPARRRMRHSRPIESFLELNLGDLVVHLVHGIARYSGMETIEKDGGVSEFHRLVFKDDVSLLVPVTKTDLIQKYVGVKGHRPQLSRLGSKGFSARKRKVAQAVADFAAELLEVQALRAARKGTAFPPDSVWQHEFEAAFPYEETDDQLETAARIKQDQESDVPMDRLVCGDVGYGKTELAMRAAFKTVEFGRQVAVLVPTTVLAQQHYESFLERMADFPIRIEMLSRFRTAGEQREILERASAGSVDILIGTHRIVSSDVRFVNLGLVIVDEEQRFGVAHKQRFKELKATVDVLTLSATPIPRTLHMSLVGLRDISTLATPPRGRQAIHTEIVPHDPALVRDAIRRELDRSGQVYFLHNRVKTIEKRARQLESLVPEARFSIVHGQMNEHDLEDRMVAFIEGRIDVLVCTTIIESGLDIPNANTIFIDDAHRFGLAELHQLRGRVGRYNRQAHAYLITPRDQVFTDVAARRLRAIEEYNDLGAGFRIAMRDLEIRGAGNILGAEQHGQIAAVGYDLYCRLLSRAVERIRAGEVPFPTRVREADNDDGRGVPARPRRPRASDLGIEEEADVEVALPGRYLLPHDYVPDLRGKMEAYRKLALARSPRALAAVLDELRDRYGPPPDEVHELTAVGRIREACRGTGIQVISSNVPGLLVLRVIDRAAALARLPRPRGVKRIVAVDAITVHLELEEKKITPRFVAGVLEELLGKPVLSAAGA